MTNSNHPEFLDEVVSAVGLTYEWDGYQAKETQNITKEMFNKYLGQYRYDSTQSISITSQEGKLWMSYPGTSPKELNYTGEGIFLRRESATPIKFTEAKGVIQFNFVRSYGNYQSHLKLAKDEQMAGDALNTDDYAIKLLTINTDLYPDSANTWDSLAFAYQQANIKHKAIQHYRNALKRDSTFPSALKGLAELENK